MIFIQWEHRMKFNKIMEHLTTIAKIVSFISLVMTVVIKTRILLGIQVKKEAVKDTSKDIKHEN